VEQGATAQQKVVTGSLQDIVRQAEDARVRAPAVIVIGEVARLHHDLDWFDPWSLNAIASGNGDSVYAHLPAALFAERYETVE
jgi:hypothetical protein